MRVLVLGSSGMVGSALMTHLEDRGDTPVGLDVAAKDANARLDISNWDQVRSCRHFETAELVVLLAAATDVDACEKDPDLAFRVNAFGPQLVARRCAELDRPLVQVSTAAVFAGNPKREPYTEFDAPAPVNQYAVSKLHGEIAVRESLRRHYIVRAGWMIGGGVEDKKFVGKIVAQLLEGKRKLLAVDDKRGSPTYTVDFAKNLMALAATGHYGTYHMANHGSCTRHDIARKIVEFMGVDCVVDPVPSSYFPLPAARPDSEVLRNRKLELIGLDLMPPWEQSLKDYLRWLVPALQAKR